MTSKNNAYHQIEPLMASRFSSNDFSPVKPVSKEILSSLIEAARWAPSGNNRQPWRYILFDENDQEALDNARSCLSENNLIWAINAPVLILAVAEITTESGKVNKKALHDLGMANENLLLQATALGLNCHPVGGFSHEKATDFFNIPNGYSPELMIVIGFPSQKDNDVNQSERNRKKPGEIAFYSKWNHPI